MTMTGIDQLRQNLGPQVQKPFLQSSNQFQILTPQQQQQQQLLAQAQAQGSLGSTPNYGDLDPRRFRLLPRGSLNGKDGQPTGNDGSVGSPIQSSSPKLTQFSSSDYPTIQKYGFLRLSGMMFSGNPRALKNSSLSLEDCEFECRRNCSCIAYASAHDNRTGCSLLDGESMNIRETSSNVPDLYVHLSASEFENNTSSDRGKKKRKQVIIALTISLSILLLGFFMCYFCRRKLMHKGKKPRSIIA